MFRQTTHERFHQPRPEPAGGAGDENLMSVEVHSNLRGFIS
jgi:hypothetical protein